MAEEVQATVAELVEPVHGHGVGSCCVADSIGDDLRDRHQARLRCEQRGELVHGLCRPLLGRKRADGVLDVEPTGFEVGVCAPGCRLLLQDRVGHCVEAALDLDDFGNALRGHSGHEIPSRDLAHCAAQTANRLRHEEEEQADVREGDHNQRTEAGDRDRLCLVGGARGRRSRGGRNRLLVAYEQPGLPANCRSAREPDTRRFRPACTGGVAAREGHLQGRPPVDEPVRCGSHGLEARQLARAEAALEPVEPGVVGGDAGVEGRQEGRALGGDKPALVRSDRDRVLLDRVGEGDRLLRPGGERSGIVELPDRGCQQAERDGATDASRDGGRGGPGAETDLTQSSHRTRRSSPTVVSPASAFLSPSSQRLSIPRLAAAAAISSACCSRLTASATSSLIRRSWKTPTLPL